MPATAREIANPVKREWTSPWGIGIGIPNAETYSQMHDHNNLADDTFLASQADLAGIAALLAGLPHRGGRAPRISSLAVHAFPSRSIPSDDALPKEREPLVMRAPGAVDPEYPRRERLRAEILAILQSQPVIHTTPPSAD